MTTLSHRCSMREIAPLTALLREYPKRRRWPPRPFGERVGAELGCSRRIRGAGRTGFLAQWRWLDSAFIAAMQAASPAEFASGSAHQATVPVQQGRLQRSSRLLRSRPSPPPPAHSSTPNLHRGLRRGIRIQLDQVGSPSKGLELTHHACNLARSACIKDALTSTTRR